jgi:ketosteroid isomerase-like protein
MRHPARWIVVAIAGAALQACASKAEPPAQAGQANTENDVAAINAAQDRELAMAATGNADSMATVGTSDAELMPPNEPAVHGLDAMKKWAETMFSQASVSGRYTSSDVTVSGDLAVARYTGELTITPKAGGAPVTERIKGIHVMKRQPDGSWKIAQDVWNSDAPAVAASLPPAKSK